MENSLLLLYEEKSRFNNVEAILFLVDYYLKNDEKNKAFELLKKFENIPDKEGKRKLAYFYQYGIGIETDLDKAISIYEQAYELGDLIAGYNLALIYTNKKRYDLAVSYLTFGRINNHVSSIKVLGDLYRLGLGVEKNVDIAVNLYKEALELGDESLYDQIGIIYYQKKQYLEAFDYFTKGANKLDKNALYHLGICYSKGEGTYLDIQKAIKYFELAIKQGDEHSLYNLALIYREGIGVNKDIEKSENYMKRYENIKNVQK